MKIYKKYLTHGFTFIELLVVVAITAFLAMSVTTNVISFQNDAKLDAAALEFASTLETARQKSVNGEVPAAGMDFDPDHMPYWVVTIISDKQYRIDPKCKFTDGSDCPPGTEIYTMPSGTISPDTGTVDFERLSGKTTQVNFEVRVAGYFARKQQVNIDSLGKVTITKIDL